MMDWNQLLFGVFSGDMGALSVLFLLMLPFILVYAGIASLVNKTKEKKK